MSNKTCESDFLDYKEELLDDEKLLKQVSAFANTHGGFLVFGIKESGKGGYPVSLFGIDRSVINKERMEQIVLSNVYPRLYIRTKIIEHDSDRVFLVLQIPDSYLKPHMNSRDNKYYRRHQFEALPMTETEVGEAYRRRFTGYEKVENYISEVLFLKKFLSPSIIGQIVVIPTTLNRMIDISREEFDWINILDLRPKIAGLTYVPSSPIPSTYGVKCEALSSSPRIFREKLEIHRNGCVHYLRNFGESISDRILFLYHVFCLKLLHTFQFASSIYQRYNFFGDVKITCKLEFLGDSYLPRLNGTNRALEEYPCQTSEIQISREVSTAMLETDHEYIASGIMDEISNNYGLWKCPLFDEKRKFKETIFS